MCSLTHHGRSVLALACGVCCAATARAQLFTFDTSTQGWQVYNIAFNGEFISPSLGPVNNPAFDAAVGLPAGSLRVTDLASETWIGAPASVLGDRSSEYGAFFEFDIQYRTHDNATYAAVALAGNEFSLFVAQPSPPLNVWLHWSFPLRAGSWKVNSINGPDATQAQMLAVLAHLRGVYIHTEWTTGNDDTSVDNIRFGTIAASCNLADITLVGGTAESPGTPDSQLTVDDLIVFVNLFSDGAGCPGVSPCSRADVTGIGGPPEAPDGQLTVDDIIAFVNAFSEGC